MHIAVISYAIPGITTPHKIPENGILVNRAMTAKRKKKPETPNITGLWIGTLVKK